MASRNLSNSQKTRFWRDGFLMIPDAVTGDDLQALQDQFLHWADESRAYSAPYGETTDNRPRFDLEPGHSASSPALRRVASPTEVSDICKKITFDSAIGDYVAALIGPNVRFHHAKMNSKLPGSKTVVKWHQDFPFDPHSNTDQITALLFLDDVFEENGPLQVVAGSHNGPIHSLWQNGQFTGAIEPSAAQKLQDKAVNCAGTAGTLCMMHVCLAHASGVNRSQRPRTLYINTYAAADAVPLAPIAVPSRHAGCLVRGVEPGTIRATAFDIQTPEIPKSASFFDQQSTAG